CLTPSKFSNAALSVNSSSITDQSPGNCERFDKKRSQLSVPLKSAAETLNDTRCTSRYSKPCSVSSEIACCITKSVMPQISPFCSANGMKSQGGMTPRSG